MTKNAGPRRPGLGLLLLHALPLDASMWTNFMDLLPGSTVAPTLYGFGNSLEDWAAAALRLAGHERLIVVGCSIGGSCALEVAAAAPERVAALVLIGTKAKHHPDPVLFASALDVLMTDGIDRAWARYWAPLFSASADRQAVEAARRAAQRQSPRDLARGITAFHRRRSRERVAAAFRGPLAVVSGDEDRAPGPSAGARLAASSPRGRLHVVPACGHYVPLERPEALRGILGDVIARHGPGDP